MKRIIGIVIGVAWLGMAFLAFRRALSGWDVGYGDVGVWWSIIATLLTIAAVGAIVGTLIHTRRRTG